jgi:hypothetical protein
MTNDQAGWADYEQAMQLADECLAELGIKPPPMSVAEFRAAFEDMWGFPPALGPQAKRS